MTGPADPLGLHGGHAGLRGARTVVASFGDVPGESDALARGAGVVPLAGLSTHAASGADARGFLHRMLTQDVKSLHRGHASPSLFLDVRGRVQADLVLWDVGTRFLLVETPESAAAIPSLEKYVIADDVRFSDESGAWVHALLAGERAPEVAARAASALVAAGAFAARLDLRARPAFRVLAPAASAVAVFAALRDAGATPAGEDALDVARVETLFPWFGAEWDDRVLPNESALDAAISWTKGCYLGQEPVVMAKHRGHAPSLLARLAVEPGPLPPRDAPLLADAKPTGRVTTAVSSGDAGRGDGGPVVLGYVRFERAKAGEVLALEDGRAARVDAVVAT